MRLGAVGTLVIASWRHDSCDLKADYRSGHWSEQGWPCPSPLVSFGVATEGSLFLSVSRILFIAPWSWQPASATVVPVRTRCPGCVRGRRQGPNHWRWGWCARYRLCSAAHTCPARKPPLKSAIIPGCNLSESGATAPNTTEAPTFGIPVKKGLNRLRTTRACNVGPDAALAPPRTLSSIPTPPEALAAFTRLVILLNHSGNSFTCWRRASRIVGILASAPSTALESFGLHTRRMWRTLGWIPFPLLAQRQAQSPWSSKRPHFPWSSFQVP